MKTPKILAFALALTLFAALLTGCKNDAKTEKPTSSELPATTEQKPEPTETPAQTAAPTTTAEPVWTAPPPVFRWVKRSRRFCWLNPGRACRIWCSSTGLPSRSAT